MKVLVVGCMLAGFIEKTISGSDSLAGALGHGRTSSLWTALSEGGMSSLMVPLSCLEAAMEEKEACKAQGDLGRI